MLDFTIIEAIRQASIVLRGTDDCDAVLDLIGNASVVLLGEATHGTHEFYRTRAEITKRLIAEKGFAAVALESDWPDALRVSRYVQAMPSAERDDTARAALGGYTRFPRWMWRNTDFVALVDWLQRHNAGIAAAEQKVGVFGLDLYSLRASMDAVVQYLDKVDPEAAARARLRYACFDHMAEDPQRYGYATTFGLKKDCELEVMRQLIGMTAKLEHYEKIDGIAGFDEAFYAAQHARVAQNAEAYYRAMFLGRNESWNVRDSHMMDTLDALRGHLERRSGQPAKIVVWAHNSHIGDARATEMGEHGQLNLGQLARQRLGMQDTFLLGFSTHAGTVTAASEWDGLPEHKTVLPSRDDSIERVLHDAGHGHFLLPLCGNAELSAHFQERRLERAIGVVYLPQSERLSHYFYTDLAQQFDAIIHFDKTRALKPLDVIGQSSHEELPETYPSGM